MEMMRCLRGLAEHAEDLSLAPGISAGGSQPSVTPALGDPMASYGFQAQCTHHIHKPIHTHMHIQVTKNKTSQV